MGELLRVRPSGFVKFRIESFSVSPTPQAMPPQRALEAPLQAPSLGDVARPSTTGVVRKKSSMNAWRGSTGSSYSKVANLRTWTERAVAASQMQQADSGRTQGIQNFDQLTRCLAMEARANSSDLRSGRGSPPTFKSSEQPLQISEDMLGLFRPSSASPNESAKLFDPRQTGMWCDGLQSRMERLMVDVDLAHGAMLEASTSTLKGNHLDRTRQWLEDCNPGGSLPAPRTGSPSYLTFTKDDLVMTGSLRVEPQEKSFAPLPWSRPRQRPGWMDRGRKQPPAQLFCKGSNSALARSGSGYWYEAVVFERTQCAGDLGAGT